MALRVTTTDSGFAGTASIVVLERSAGQVAPEGIKFGITLGTGFTTAGPSGSDVYDPRMHDLYYSWDFGAAGAYNYTAPTKVVAIGAHESARYAFGPKVSWVCRTPGTHTITCTVTEPATGVQALATLSVTVGDPATQFAGANTIVVDTTGAGLSTTYPGSSTVTTLNAAITAILGTSATTPRRVVLRRGQTFTLGANANLGHSSTWPTVHFVAAAEAGLRPIVNASGQTWRDTLGSGTGRTKDYVWQNIDFRGTWSSTTESGAIVDLFTMYTKPPMQFLLDGCRCDGFGMAVYTRESEADASVKAGIYVNDTEVTNWQNYGVFPSIATTVAITGSAICQHVDALGGGDKNTYPTSAGHHGPVRISRIPDFLVHSSDFFSRNGWITDTTGGSTVQTQQSCLRYDTDALGGGFASVQASTLEGGSEQIKFTKDTGTLVHKPSNVVIEKNYFLGSHQTRQFIEMGSSCWTFRNNIGKQPAVTTRLPNFNPVAWLLIKDADTPSSGENLSGPIRIYSNTFVSEAATAISTTVYTVPGDSQAFSNVAATNNIRVQTVAAPTATTDQPLATTAAFTPVMKEYQHKAAIGGSYVGPVAGTATPSTAAWLSTPQAGSAALANATIGQVADDDFYGVRRPASKDRGAIQVTA